MNHLRLPTSVPTFALNEVKCLLIAVRSSSIRSRKFERRSGPSLITPSTTRATAFSQGVELLVVLPGAELEIRDVLAPQAAPGLALGRDGRRGEDAAADQVEERRGELERARLAALSQQRRHEGGRRSRSAAPARTRGRSRTSARGRRTRRPRRRRGTPGSCRAGAGRGRSATDAPSRGRCAPGPSRTRRRRPSPRRRSSPGRCPRRHACLPSS